MGRLLKRRRLFEEAIASPKRRSPVRRGGRLFKWANGFGLGLDGLLGLNWLLGSSFRVFGPRLKGFGPNKIYLKRFRVLLHSELVFSHHWACVAGSNRECLQFAPCFSKTEFLKSIFEKVTCRNAAVYETTYLTFKLCSGRQSWEFKPKKSNFKLTASYWKRDRVPRVFLSRSATY